MQTCFVQIEIVYGWRVVEQKGATRDGPTLNIPTTTKS